MTVHVVSPRPVPVSSNRRGAEAAIARRAFRQVRTTATVLAGVLALTVAGTAVSYVTSFPTEASRRAIVLATSGDTGLAVLLGPTTAVGSVGGYTVYKLFVFLTAVGAIWGLLLATRMLRGEEEAGRWQLVLAGGTRAGRATAATLLALAGAVVVVLAGTTLGALAAGAKPGVGFGAGDSLLYGFSIALAPAFFVGVGAVTSQLSRTRRGATSLGMAVFGVAFVVRMVADASPGTVWLRWFTPFGWTELVQPFTRNDGWPLLLAAACTVALGGVACVLASRRDLGGSVLVSHDVSAVRPFGLGSPLGLALRLELPTLVAWVGGTAAAAFALGIIAKLTISTSVPSSVSSTLRKFGVQGSFAVQYFGVAFLFVAAIVALLPASQLGSAAAEETTGRLTHLLVGPTRRTSWLGGRLLVAACAMVVAALVAGLVSWLGAESQGVRLPLSTMVGAGLNVVPTALVALGVGAVVLSVAPRAAAISVYAVVAWSFVLDLLTALVGGLSWLDRLSLFHAMAKAPAEDLDLVTLAVTTVLGLALCALAVALFARSDLQTE